MAGVILSITVLAIGSITPALASHSTVDVTVLFEHTARGILATETGTGPFGCGGGSCTVSVDIDNNREIRKMLRICGGPLSDTIAILNFGAAQTVKQRICTQGPFTVTATATLNTVHPSASVFLNLI